MMQHNKIPDRSRKVPATLPAAGDWSVATRPTSGSTSRWLEPAEISASAEIFADNRLRLLRSTAGLEAGLATSLTSVGRRAAADLCRRRANEVECLAFREGFCVLAKVEQLPASCCGRAPALRTERPSQGRQADGLATDYRLDRRL